MFNRKEKLSMLQVERAKQIEKIRKIESNMKELWDKEQSIRSQLCQENLSQVELQEEILLNEVVKQLDILDRINEKMEVMWADL